MKPITLLTVGALLLLPLHNAISQNAENLMADPQITFDFENAPLELVLDHMSQELGFVIIKDTNISGEATFFTRQPVSKATAVEALISILAKNNYALIQNGDVLTIVQSEDATFRTPIIKETTPGNIPKSDRVVTQILQIKYLDAIRLVTNLRLLLPEDIVITANESSNTIIVTDTQANIRRVAEIIEALDTSISSIATMKVFQLVNADAAELAEMVEELFEAPSTGNNNNNNRGGRGGRGGRNGGGNNNNFFQIAGLEGNPAAVSTGNSEARQAATSVRAVADERTNSLIVSAPDAYIATISTLIEQIDTVESELTDMEVFKLENANAEEVVEQINGVFEEDNSTTTAQFGRGGGGRGGRGGFNFGGGAGTAGSDRTLALTRVVAVADPRTNSVIVDASPGQMFKVARMIAQLDANPARKEKVHVIQLSNADGPETVAMLQQMFPANANQTVSTQAPASSALGDRRGNGSTLDVGTTGN